MNKWIHKLDDWISNKETLTPLPEKDVFQLCTLAKEILICEPNIKYIQGPVAVVGDIHGQYSDLIEIFRINGDAPFSNYLFLGDYVDRGQKSVETITLLVLLKIRYPDRITLIRGNHESEQPNKFYGFYEECIEKYGDERVWSYFSDLFCYLPIGSIINDRYLAVHGGLSPSLCSIDQIQELNRVKQEGGFCDLLWSDPYEVAGWKLSPRGIGYCFGEDISKQFNRENALQCIVRGHQVISYGYQFCHDKNVITVFSAPKYCGMKNTAAVMVISDNQEFSLFGFFSFTHK
ncbi:uncharacterized protein [Blastocystis hominis]|uniref:Serine/threonine-protein phosphatase n=1 Tax=Blastocystis hominis TaxID=12968 RepID=D8MAA5_BLAHO|nr:uncharacterized protein [Blastocystis hominis]CBK24994.2 unnamed protein product [Blastocystis hominis]|eukprot:XP_012899042.1 uncharacterized protein [Blastocystis hominis]